MHVFFRFAFPPIILLSPSLVSCSLLSLCWPLVFFSFKRCLLVSRLLCCAPRCFHPLLIRLSLWSIFSCVPALVFESVSLDVVRWTDSASREAKLGRHVSKLTLLLSFRYFSPSALLSFRSSLLPLFYTSTSRLLYVKMRVSLMLVRVVVPSSTEASLSRDRTEINMIFTSSLGGSLT